MRTHPILTVGLLGAWVDAVLNLLVVLLPLEGNDALGGALVLVVNTTVPILTALLAARFVDSPETVDAKVAAAKEKGATETMQLVELAAKVEPAAGGVDPVVALDRIRAAVPALADSTLEKIAGALAA